MCYGAVITGNIRSALASSVMGWVQTRQLEVARACQPVNLPTSRFLVCEVGFNLNVRHGSSCTHPVIVQTRAVKLFSHWTSPIPVPGDAASRLEEAHGKEERYYGAGEGVEVRFSDLSIYRLRLSLQIQPNCRRSNLPRHPLQHPAESLGWF